MSVAYERHCGDLQAGSLLFIEDGEPQRRLMLKIISPKVMRPASSRAQQTKGHKLTCEQSRRSASQHLPHHVRLRVSVVVYSSAQECHRKGLLCAIGKETNEC